LTFVDEAARFIRNAGKTKLVTPRRIPEYLLFRNKVMVTPNVAVIDWSYILDLSPQTQKETINLTTHSLWRYHVTQALLLVVSSRHTNFLHEKILL